LLPAAEETSDYKEAPALRDEWRSATITYGAQCVMTFGEHLMLRLSADSWDSLPLVSA